MQEAKDREGLKQAKIIREAAATVKRNFANSDVHSSPCPSTKSQPARKSSVSARKKMHLDENDDESSDAGPYQSSDEDDYASCLYCNELYSLSNSGDAWIKYFFANCATKKFFSLLNISFVHLSFIFSQ